MKVTKNDLVEIRDMNFETLWDGLVAFASYSFNKSHAIGYSQIAYQTAKLYKYRWQEYMEWHLNNGSQEKYKTALNHLVEAGYVPIYPDYHNMANNKLVVYSDRERVYKDGSKLVPDRDFVENRDYEFSSTGKIRQITFPGDEPKQYDELVNALFDQTIRPTAFLKGVFDNITKDRAGLLDLVNALTKKQFESMLYSQITNESSLQDILESMKIAGVVDKYDGTPRKGFDIEIFPYRGAVNKKVRIRPDFDSDVIIDDITFDMKYFKSIRKGLLGSIPDEMDTNGRFWQAAFQEIDRRKDRADLRYGEGWFADPVMKKKYINFAKQFLNEKLDDFKYKERPGIDPKIKEPVRAMIQSIAGRGYNSGTKVELKFGNGEDFYYFPNWMIPNLKKLGKNAVIEVTFVFSPFVQYKTGDIIMDYDVKRVRNLSTNMFMDVKATKTVSKADRDVREPNQTWTKEMNIME